MPKERNIIDRGMIEEFAQAVSNEKARNVFYALSDDLDEVSNEISQTNSLVTEQNVELFLAGDFLTNTLTQVSELNFYLSIRNAQIELNSIDIMSNKWKNFWNKVKKAWQNRNKSSARARKKQEKKLKKANSQITESQLREKKEKPYSLVSFKNDFYEGLATKLTNLTVLYNCEDKIRILGRDEFGYRINLYPVIKHDDFFRIWEPEKGKFCEIKPFEAKSLLEKKANEISKLTLSGKEDGEILYKVIRIFKNLFYNIEKSNNYQFVESLICSVPSALFKFEDEEYHAYNVFLKVLNYLSNASIGDVRSIYNQEKTIYSQEMISVLTIRSFLKEVKNCLC